MQRRERLSINSQAEDGVIGTTPRRFGIEQSSLRSRNHAFRKNDMSVCAWNRRRFFDRQVLTPFEESLEFLRVEDRHRPLARFDEMTALLPSQL
jgi:hypothetical protein